MPVAKDAAESQIVGGCASAMFSADDVVHLMRKG